MDTETLRTLMHIVQTILSVVLVVVILVQVRGQGSDTYRARHLSQGVGLFGASDGSYRTRRGIEKTLFQFTIILSAVFIIASIFSARVF